MGEFGGDVRADGGLEGDDVVQDAEGVLTHFFAGEEFGQVGGEVQTELQGPGRDGDAYIIVSEEQAGAAAGDDPAGVEKPCFGAGGG